MRDLQGYRAILAALILLAVPAGATELDFSGDYLVNTPGSQGDHQLEVDQVITPDGIVHTVWVDHQGDPRIWHAQSTDGTAFSNHGVINLQGSAGDADSRPRIAYDPNLNGFSQYNLYVTFNESYMMGGLDNFIVWSTDGGFTWDDRVQIDTSGYATGREDPDVAVAPNGDVYVVYTDLDGSPDQIMLGYGSSLPSVFALEAMAYVQTPNQRHDPSVAVDAAGRLYVAFTEGSPYQKVWLGTSNDSGQNWSGPAEVAPFACVDDEQYHPRLAAGAAGNVALVWEDICMGYLDVVHDSSTDAGVTFVGPNQLNQSMMSSYAVDLAVDPAGRLHYAWEEDDGTGTDQIRYNRSDDWGLSLGYASPVNGDIGRNQLAPAIAAGPGGFVAVAWEDEATVPNHDILSAHLRPILFDDFDDPTFSLWTTAQEVERSADQSVDSSGYSCKLASDSKARAVSLLSQIWGSDQTGVVEFSFWDGYGSHPDYIDPNFEFVFSIQYDDGTKAGVVRSLGIVNPSSTSSYSYSPDGSSFYPTTVARTLGWHDAVISVGSGGLEIQIDPVSYPSAQPVYSDGTFQQFGQVSWTGGSLYSPYYVDQVSVTAGPLAAGPTVPALSLLGALALMIGLAAALRRHRV